MGAAHAFFDGQRGHVLFVADDDGLTEVTTLPAVPGRVIHVDDGRNSPPLHFGGGCFGLVLRWSHDTATLGEQFAHDCRAKLYKTKGAYERAAAEARTG
ncbi:hypothetical protein SAMN05444161_5307 [Rhizobiales bacterium GAS191]|nr:hypothetical protein SAMN05444161_5307 [Rhizobiales bacterium GAS191]